MMSYEIELSEVPRRKKTANNDRRKSSTISIISFGSKSRRDSVVSTPSPASTNGDIEGLEMQSTIVLSLSFFLAYTSYLAVQNLQSSVNEEKNLGVISLSCLYGASIVSGILAPTVIRLIGVKGTLVLAWSSHCIYTAANFYPHLASLVPASILLGMVTGPMWTSQSIYITACSYSYARTSKKSPYQVLSQMNGIFFTVYETTQITGNLISSLVLRQDADDYEAASNITQFCGYQECPASENTTDLADPEPTTMYTLLGIFLACDVIGLLVTVLFLTPLPKSDWSSQQTLKSSVTSCFLTLGKTELIILVPFIMFMAIEQALLLSSYTKAYISCTIGLHNVGFVMACYGGATALMAFIFSRLAKYSGRQPLILLATVIDLACLVLLYHWIPSSEDIHFIFLLPVLWGIGEGIWQTQSNALIALLFWESKEPAFANFHTWKAVGFTLTFINDIFLCLYIRILIALGILSLAILGYLAVEFLLRYRERSKHNISTKKGESHI